MSPGIVIFRGPAARIVGAQQRGHLRHAGRVRWRQAQAGLGSRLRWWTAPSGAGGPAKFKRFMRWMRTRQPMAWPTHTTTAAPIIWVSSSATDRAASPAGHGQRAEPVDQPGGHVGDQRDGYARRGLGGAAGQGRGTGRGEAQVGRGLPELQADAQEGSAVLRTRRAPDTSAGVIRVGASASSRSAQRSMMPSAPGGPGRHECARGRQRASRPRQRTGRRRGRPRWRPRYGRGRRASGPAGRRRRPGRPRSTPSRTGSGGPAGPSGSPSDPRRRR